MTHTPEPPKEFTAVVPLWYFAVVNIWTAWMAQVVATAWRERAVTLDLSGNVLHYMKFDDHDRALLGIRNSGDSNNIEEIWIATNELSDEEEDE